MPTISRTLRPFLLLFPLALVSGTPALTGCDGGIVECETGTLATEDITPDDVTPGDEIAVGSCVSVDYVGRLADGSGQFDAGRLTFIYSSSAGLISGFLVGMSELQVGETVRVTIPPELGYGSIARPDRDPDDDQVGIPACSTLEFDITLTDIYQDRRVCPASGVRAG